MEAWDEYVKAVNARNRSHLVPGNSFLSIDELPGQAAKLRDGEILAMPVGRHIPMKVASGLIHDWVGAIFIPNVTVPDVLRVVRDYKRYQNVYHPNVADSKPLATSECEDRFTLLLMNKSVVARTALDSDYRSSYIHLDDQRWYSETEATRIQQIADYETPSEHSLPVDQGTGLIWRLYSITRFQARDGGVYIEVEGVALSRDVPVSLRWLVDPIIRRISRSSLLTSLKQTEDAVLSGPNEVSDSFKGPVCPARPGPAAATVPSGATLRGSIR